MKTLKQFAEQTGYRKVKSPDEQRFVDKHEVQVNQDRAGNKDDVFKATNIKTIDRKKDRKGYNPGEDEAVYEDADQIDERWSENSKKTSKNLAAMALDTGNAVTGGLLSKSKLARKAMKWADSPDETTSKTSLKAYQARQARKVNEDAELKEAMDAAARFDHHHQHAKALLKSINQHLKTHAAEAASAKDYKGRKGPNWGHVGSMEHVATQLSHIHDQLARTGEYAVHESVELDEKKLTPAEMKKREEVAKAIKRENPKMPMAKKMAIATATAKKVAEDLDAAIGELSPRLQETMKTVFDRLNEENQQKFVAACATEEGLEKMVAFAIENRGE